MSAPTSPSSSSPAEPDNPLQHDHDNMRRRYSSQHDAEDDVPTIFRSTRTSSLDISALSPAARLSLDEGPSRTVRFSAEVDRHEINSPESSSPESPTLHSPRCSLPRPANLARIQSGVASDHRLSTSSTSPTSPTERSRGYSLRTSIFRKNVDQRHHEPVNSNNNNNHNNHNNNHDDNENIPPHLKEPVVSVSSFSDRKVKDEKATFTSSTLPNYSTWVAERSTKFQLSKSVQNFKIKLEKFILRIHDIPPSKDGRHVTLDASRKETLLDERTSKPYVENWIRSTRYTAYTFLPRQLVAQFSKLANFYFLCVAVMQMIPKLSTTGQYTTIAPLAFFVTISMLKEGFDDYRRHRLDKEENSRETTILHAYQLSSETDHRPQSPYTGANVNDITNTDADAIIPMGPLHWATVKWNNLKVGDIVKLKRDEAVPADIILLHAQNENHIAYVETMALDGETNLKTKSPTASLAEACSDSHKLATCRAQFVAEDPNINLYAFEGKVTINQKTCPLTNSEIIYRGSIIRNTPEIIGMVIYTGEECKIRMNANKNPRTKAPHLQFVLNRMVMITVAFVVCLAIFNSLAYLVWRHRVEVHNWYIQYARVPFIQIFCGFIIMFATMIPLSLYISMEIIKLAQMYFLNDIDMYDPKSNTPMEARTSTINEELGQITHIFSDKTGTLTDNEMKFRKISVAGTVWLHDTDLPKISRDLLMHKYRNKGKKATRRLSSHRNTSFANTEKDEAPEYENHNNNNTNNNNNYDKHRHSTIQYPLIQSDRRTAELLHFIHQHPNTLFATKARLLLLSIALCHTCIPEAEQDGNINFQASSPDELALVQAAQELGYLVYNREHTHLTLKHYPDGNLDAEPISEVYEIMDVIEFSSQRKRMSVVVKFPDGRICVICKGADSIVMQRLKLANLALEKAIEVEQRAEKRKSIEAQVALARRSTQMERTKSLRRTSLALDVPKRSASIHSHADTARNEVDHWLKSREQDVELIGQEIQPISERLSAQYYPRSSMAPSDTRNIVIDEDLSEFVNDSFVSNDAIILEHCFQHINEFATEGLRTLLYAYRFLSDSEYQSWKEIYHAATTSLSKREEKIESAGELIEIDLDLAGATAIEDKLQHGVPESMDKLRRASIKIWMLTGDKRETAINIGTSCRLIKDYSLVIILDKAAENVEQVIAAATIQLQAEKVAHSVIVVDGLTLSWIAQAEHRQHLFYELAILADSVICCRAQPSQKAELVHEVRKRVKSSITLAIGDGANDIAMIQEAHVGIGITGKEGLQAARSSDYSIAQFRFLNKLLLVHGRWNYIRTCKYILGTLWKEVVFFLTQALYQRYVGYTGTSLYEPWTLATFNTLFTSLPVLIIGIFEKDLQPATLLAAPELYTIGQRDGGFNFWIFLEWTAVGAAESVLIFFVAVAFYGETSWPDAGIFSLGNLTFAACVTLITAKMQLIEMHNKSITGAIAFGVSFAAIWLWNILIALIYPTTGIYKVKGGLFNSWGRDGRWWNTLFFCISIVILFELTISAVKSRWFTSDTHLFQTLEKDPEVRRRFEEASAMELRQGWEAAAEVAQAAKKSKKKFSRSQQYDEEKLDGESSQGQMEMRDLNVQNESGGSRSNSQAAYGVSAPPTAADANQSTEELERQITSRFGVKRQSTLR